MISGNDGGKGNSTIGSPAVSKNVITVGASYDSATGMKAVAGFSSRGPTV